MFPDLDSEWEGFASIIDGIQFPYVHLITVHSGIMNLLVTGDGAPTGGFGVTLPVLLHWVVDEFEYSVTGHGLPTLMYDGTTYIKRARRSKLLQAYDEDVLRVMRPSVSHFAFVGGDDCVEVLTSGDLNIVPLPSAMARTIWIDGLLERARATFET